MPMVQDEDDYVQSTAPTSPIFTFPKRSYPDLKGGLKGRPAEDSVQAGFHDGPLDSPALEAPPAHEGGHAGFGTDIHRPKRGVCDRIEYIQRLKRGESPSWSPSRNVETASDRGPVEEFQEPCSKTMPLLPPAKIETSSKRNDSDRHDSHQQGLQIERPRSALHRGDFTEEHSKDKEEFGFERGIDDSHLGYRSCPWLDTPSHQNPRPSSDLMQTSASRSRGQSLSSSYSSCFVMMPPTSPLVYSESNDDLEYSSRSQPMGKRNGSANSHRRHTFHPHDSSFGSSSDVPPPFQRKEFSHPYQAHQPRRSLNLNRSSPNTTSTPQTPTSSHSKPLSLASDPLLHRAPLVGSYEESILRGRMSTTPSKPLNFIAQIGVLGLGKCKASLKCPPHVTLQFPAVFFSYASTGIGRTVSEDGPSPYVGQIDLENNLPHVEPDDRRDSKRRRRSNSRTPSIDHAELIDDRPITSVRGMKRAEMRRRTPTLPKVPPGGSYRIPEKGQIQIIIKNPNKTAVKLFLVPYDLAGMEPGTKTFVRQKIYFRPITEVPRGGRNAPNGAAERGTLRYLVHLPICCLSRGRFYLYKSIRVVFANRVPDSTERLQNEVQYPEPKYTAYKPERESGASSAGPSPAHAREGEEAFQRMKELYDAGASRTDRRHADDAALLDTPLRGASPYPHALDRGNSPVDPIPFPLHGGRNAISPQRSQDSLQAQSTAGAAASSSQSSETASYNKLGKGDVGYGGNPFLGAHGRDQTAVAEGLLAAKLKGLDIRRWHDSDSRDGSGLL